MLSEMISGFVDRQRWLDGVGDALESVTGATFDHLGPLSRPVQDALHGTFVGHPVHPILTDIPIGAWTTAMALDLAGIEDGADYAINFGLIGAVGAAVSGMVDWRHTQGTQRRVGSAHALFNIAATSLYAVSAYQRAQGNRGAGATFAGLGYACVMAGGYLGGDLAYALGMGVNRNAWTMGEAGYVPVMPLSELPDDQPTHASADGEDLVLVRQGDTVYALANSCAHLGAPLADGEVEDGTIVCPWHGSAFKLESGRVHCGPSAYNQPCYATRVRDGQVEVKLTGEYGDREPWYRVQGQAEES